MNIVKGTKTELGSVFKKAASLRYSEYLKMGFIKENESKTYADTYDDHATHFVGIKNNNVVGTISIIYPPLPLEELFKEEVEKLKKIHKAKRVVEISRFAILPEYQVKNSQNPIAPKLFKEVYKKIILKNTKLIFATVHPKYVERYLKYGFKRYGKTKAYPKMEENPAILLYQTRKQAILTILKKIFFPRKQKKSF